MNALFLTIHCKEILFYIHFLIENSVIILTCAIGLINLTPLYDTERQISSLGWSLDFITVWIDFFVDSIPLNSLIRVEPKYYKKSKINWAKFV